MMASMDLQGWTQMEAAFRQAPHVVREELFKAAAEADMLLEREVKDLTPTATGMSRASIFSRERALPDGAIGVVGTAQPHMVYVELGTQPHFPPVEAIEDWVRVKFGVNEEAAVHAIAFRIARKIAARGTVGAAMFKRTWAKQQAQVARIFEAARDRIAARIAGAAT